jgi:hypothetical protein
MTELIRAGLEYKKPAWLWCCKAPTNTKKKKAVGRVGWIDLAQDKETWLDLVNVAMNL